MTIWPRRRKCICTPPKMRYAGFRNGRLDWSFVASALLSIAKALFADVAYGKQAVAVNGTLMFVTTALNAMVTVALT